MARQWRQSFHHDNYYDALNIEYFGEFAIYRGV